MQNQNKIKRGSSQKKLKQLQKIGFQKEVQKLQKDYSNNKRFKQLKHQQRSKSLKALPNKKLNQNSGNFLQPTKIISVTASKWAIFDYFSNRYIRGYRAHDQFNLSIFSKLLVFATVNALVTKHKLDITRFQNIVTNSVLKLFPKKKKQKHSQGSNLIDLQVDDILTLQDLLHLLLISESQAPELVIAVNLGAYLDKKRRKQYYSVYDADDSLFKTHIKQFYGLVNTYCQSLKLQNIKYVEFDPKLKNQKNKCSAFDITTLSVQCLKMPLFDKIMKKKQFEVTIKYINQDGVIDNRKKVLQNKTIANKFLSYFNVCRNWDQKQFMDSHCSVYYQQQGIQPVVMVALGSYSPIDREKDIQQIIQWYINNFTKKKKKQDKLEATFGKQSMEQEHIGRSESKVLPRFKTQLTQQLQTILDKKLSSKIAIKNSQKLQPIKNKSKIRNITQY